MADSATSDWAAWITGLVARFETPLIQYAVHLTGDVETARDVVQEAFLRLCAEDRAKIESRVVPWLFRVCRNRAIDIQRKRKPVEPLIPSQAEALPAQNPGPDQMAERREDQEQLETLLAGLSESDQEVLRLKFQHGLSYREISEVTGLTVSNVGFRIHVTLKRLRLWWEQGAGTANDAVRKGGCYED